MQLQAVFESWGCSEMRSSTRWLVFVIWAALSGGVNAQTYSREELRIPAPGTGARGLEAILVRPDSPDPHPLALINHGTPRKPEDRAAMTPLRFLPQAMEFARRGWAAAVVMRRGYGDSGGAYSESSGPCNNPDYLTSAVASTTDVRAAAAHLRKRADIDPSRLLAVGVSTGGLATVALTVDPPPGLIAGINFAGGRGSPRDNEVCAETRLIAAFAALGKRSRVPMLWVYSDNDRYFGPALAQRLKDSFVAGGGKVDFVKAPPFGEDGHSLFASGIPEWTPYVDEFLRRHGFALRDSPLPLPPLPAIAPPPPLSPAGRKAFVTYLRAAPNRAFAMSPKGAYGWQSGERTVEAAEKGALERCAKFAPDCKIVVVNDEPAP
jgi:dienelactone hydrolase